MDFSLVNYVTETALKWFLLQNFEILDFSVYQNEGYKMHSSESKIQNEGARIVMQDEDRQQG